MSGYIRHGTCSRGTKPILNRDARPCWLYALQPPTPTVLIREVKQSAQSQGTIDFSVLLASPPKQAYALEHRNHMCGRPPEGALIWMPSHSAGPGLDACPSMTQLLRAVIACSAAKLRHACPDGSLACCARACFDTFCGLPRMHARMHSTLCLLR